MSSPIPHHIGGYVLLEPLGSGGAGTVWKAQPEGGGALVAFKLLHFTGQDSPAARARLLRETRLVNQIQLDEDAPAGIACIVDVESEGVEAFIVSELIPGPTLAETLKAGALAAPECLRIGWALDYVLQHLHEEKIAHRDLKPANVILKDEGESTEASAAGTGTGTGAGNGIGAGAGTAASRAAGGVSDAGADAGVDTGATSAMPAASRALGKPVLIDFGLARRDPADQVTETGLLLGTPGYVAPELLRGGKQNFAAWVQGDWYALCSLLLQCLTGRPPFGVGNLALTRQLAADPDVEGLSVPLQAWFRAALAADPQERVSHEDLLAAIEADWRDDWADDETTELVSEEIADTMHLTPLPQSLPLPANHSQAWGDWQAEAGTAELAEASSTPLFPGANPAPSAAKLAFSPELLPGAGQAALAEELRRRQLIPRAGSLALCAATGVLAFLPTLIEGFGWVMALILAAACFTVGFRYERQKKRQQKNLPNSQPSVPAVALQFGLGLLAMLPGALVGSLVAALILWLVNLLSNTLTGNAAFTWSNIFADAAAGFAGRSSLPVQWLWLANWVMLLGATALPLTASIRRGIAVLSARFLPTKPRRVATWTILTAILVLGGLGLFGVIS